MTRVLLSNSCGENYVLLGHQIGESETENDTRD